MFKNKKVRKFYKKAKIDFGFTEKYEKSKNIVDFIMELKKYFKNNVEYQTISYKEKKYHINDVMIMLKNSKLEMETILNKHNVSILVSGITIITSMIGWTFLSNDTLEFELRAIIFLLAMIFFWLLMYIIDYMVLLYNELIVNDILFYGICISVLDEIKKEFKGNSSVTEIEKNSIKEVNKNVQSIMNFWAIDK